MIELTTTDFTRRIQTIPDQVERKGEEVVLTRNKQKIARIMPGSPHLTATETMGGLYKTVSGKEELEWVAESRSTATLDQIADPRE